MRNIRIIEDAYQRFKHIREKRPQDDNNSQTFEHILEFYEERHIAVLDPKTEKGIVKTSHIIAGNSASPVIADTLKEKQLAPTRNNVFMQIGGEKL